MHATSAGLRKGDFHDFPGDSIDLDIHLQRGYATGRTSDFEIHVAKVVFIPHDIRKNYEFFLALDQSHRDTGNRRLDCHSSIHQRQTGTTNGCHGTGTVGFGNFRYHADCIGKLAHIGHHCEHTPFGEAAVADFPTFG